VDGDVVGHFEDMGRGKGFDQGDGRESAQH
jgi:hypothetical protein